MKSSLSDAAFLARGNIKVYFQAKFLDCEVVLLLRSWLLQVSLQYGNISLSISLKCAFQSVTINFYCINNYISITSRLNKYLLFLQPYSLRSIITARALSRSITMKTHRLRNQIIYEVQTILDEAVLNYEPHYLIKWKNLGHQHDTWEPISNLVSIRDYLQFWIKRRKIKNMKNKQKKEKNYKSIKPYLYSGEFLSKKKSGKYAKLGNQILSRKKTWQKYIENDKNEEKDDKIIDLEDDEDIETQFLKKNEGLINQILHDKPSKPNEGNEEIFEQEQKLQTDKDKGFKVVGSINMDNIKKIVRVFDWKGTKCLQIQMGNGQMFNIKEQEIRKLTPQMLLQFYEDEGIQF